MGSPSNGSAERVALDALEWYLDREAIDASTVLFARGRAHRILQRWDQSSVTVWQPSRMHARAFRREQLCESAELGAAAGCAVVLYLPTRSRTENKETAAFLLEHCSPETRFVSALENDHGAKSFEKDLRALGYDPTVESKLHCRILDLTPGKSEHPTTTIPGIPVRCEATGYLSHPSLFGWDKLDPASELLAQSLPEDLAGMGADFGAGYGYLSCQVLEHHKGVSSIVAIETERAGVTATEENLRERYPDKEFTTKWLDVTTDELPHNRDFIVMNPPFHVDRAAEPEKGIAFLRAAQKCLRTGGRLFLVFNQHLGYEKYLRELFASCDVVGENSRFRAMVAVR